METIELAPDLCIPRVLTGLWQIADMERDGRTLDLGAAAAAMGEYAAAGLTAFDMADHYGSAEDVAGRCVERSAPGAVQVLTKWVPKPGPVTRADVRAAIERSLTRLRSERIDLLQFHAWSYADPAYLDCLFYLQELKDEGLIRALGLTNFDTAHLRLVLESGIEVVSNQVCYSLLDGRPGERMGALCSQKGIHLLAYGTLAGGLLTERYLGQPEPDAAQLATGSRATWSQMKYMRFLEAAGGWQDFQSLLRVVASVADRLGVSMANVACRYILDQPGVGGVIIGARLTERAHVEDNFRLLSFSLDDRDRADIDAAVAMLTPIPGDCGDEYRKPPFLTASGDLSHHFDSFPAPYAPREGEDGRSRVLSGTPWEDIAGYSRAMRRGRRIWVSGTTATHGDRLIGGADAAAQAHFVIDKIEAAVVSLGGRLEDIVRTRVYVADASDWEPVARAHGERFGHVQPANTLVQAQLIGDGYLVEMEAEAVVDDPPV